MHLVSLPISGDRQVHITSFVGAEQTETHGRARRQSATQRADRVRLAQCGATLLECGLVVITKHIFERHR